MVKKLWVLALLGSVVYTKEATHMAAILDFTKN